MLQTETLRKKLDVRQGEKGELNHPEHTINRDLRFEVKVGKEVRGDRKEKKGRKWLENLQRGRTRVGTG